jgi:exonuclease III
MAVWNVRGISHKLDELQKELTDKKTDIAILAETKKKLKGTTGLEHYIFIYTGGPREKELQLVWH